VLQLMIVCDSCHQVISGVEYIPGVEPSIMVPKVPGCSEKYPVHLCADCAKDTPRATVLVADSKAVEQARALAEAPVAPKQKGA